MKKAILVLAGVVHNLDALKSFISENEGYILCADGGANYLKSIDVIPDEIIGDLDSINPATKKYWEDKKVLINKYPSEKDDSDSALAVEYLIEKGYEKIYVFGALGKRIDHSLGNIMMFLGKYRKNIEFVDSDYLVFSPDSGIVIDRVDNSYISIFALTDEVTGFKQTGLKYTPENGIFKFNYPLGLSNEFVDNKATLSWETGDIMVMIVNKNCR